MEYFEKLLKDIDEQERTVCVFEDRKYTNHIKQCIYKLLGLNVSASKVTPVIETVLKIVNIKANQLPSKSTVLDLNLQRLFLAQKQISEVFAKEKNTTLLTDETSKFGARYMGYEAADSQVILWVLGLREIETKSASNMLRVFQQILSDLNEASSTCGNQVAKEIVCHIVATMSDRAATEVKFNDLLNSYRNEVLPLCYSNCHSFSEAERNSLETICNYFCGLYALVNFADATQTAIKEVEKGFFVGKGLILDQNFHKESEPGTCRLIRTASKAFGSGSGVDEKYGCQGQFKVFIKDFLKQHKLHSVPINTYRG